MSTLTALADAISVSARKIDAICASKATPFPSLDDVFTAESEAIRNDPEVMQAAAMLVAAADQIIATVWPPAMTLFVTTLGLYITSAMGVATSQNVAEILHEAGPDGMHIDKIAERTSVSPNKLGRVLRLLCTRNIFREISPDVFCNNRLSSMLDTGKSIDKILENREGKLEGTNGVTAFVGMATDEDFKAAAYIEEHISDPETAFCDDPTKTPMSRAMGTDRNLWDWMALPQNSFRFTRFNIQMGLVQNMAPVTAMLQGFEWASLEQGATVVDVGGGHGNVSLVLAKAFKHINFVVQDRPSVIDEAHAFWADELSEAVPSGRVTLEPHDFFEPQPPTRSGPAVFMMRFILHDWADSYSAQILKHLRAAAAPHTRLVIVDLIVPYACADTSTSVRIPGAAIPTPPPPLLPNMGVAGLHTYLADLHMMATLNGQERTLGQMTNLLLSSGWEIVQLYRTPAFPAQIIARPV